MNRTGSSFGYASTAVILIGIAAALLLPSPAPGADGSDIVITLTTNRSLYLHAAPVLFTVSKCNPTGEPITVLQFCPCCHYDFSIFDSSGHEVVSMGHGCISVVQTITWQPGECTTETFEWLQTPGTFGPATGPFVDAGTYSALYRWRFPTFSTEAASPDFTIAPPSIPTFPVVTIDFETLPDGSILSGGPIANRYVGYGVTFHEDGYGNRMPALAAKASGDHYAQSNVTTYPPGFNIVAEFSVPVTLVAADVKTAVGVTVTMKAFAQDGTLLATSESADSADFWKGRIEVSTDRAISRVEFWPSVIQAGVGIDNLLIGRAQEIPALDTIGLLLLAVSLAAAGTFLPRRPLDPPQS